MLTPVRFGEIYKIVVSPKPYAVLEEQWTQNNGGISWKAVNAFMRDHSSEEQIERRHREELDCFNRNPGEDALAVIYKIGTKWGDRGTRVRDPQSLEKTFIPVDKQYTPPEAPVPEGYAPGFEAWFVTDGPMHNDLEAYKWARTFQSVLDKAKGSGKPAPANFQRRAEMFIEQFIARLKSDAMDLPTDMSDS